MAAAHSAAHTRSLRGGATGQSPPSHSLVACRLSAHLLITPLSLLLLLPPPASCPAQQAACNRGCKDWAAAPGGAGMYPVLPLALPSAGLELICVRVVCPNTCAGTAALAFVRAEAVLAPLSCNDRHIPHRMGLGGFPNTSAAQQQGQFHGGALAAGAAGLQQVCMRVTARVRAGCTVRPAAVLSVCGRCFSALPSLHQPTNRPTNPRHTSGHTTRRRACASWARACRSLAASCRGSFLQA
jgi:hypothetical protein